MKITGKGHKAGNLLLFAFILVFGVAFHAVSADNQRFELVTVSPDFELNGRGKNIDSIAFWEAPDPSKSLMFVTAKKNSLVEVWKFPFANNEQPPMTHSTFSKSNVNGVVVDQDTNLLYVSIGAPASTTSVFKLPQLDFVTEIRKEGVNLRSEPNLALLKLRDGSKRIYISADNIVYLHDAATGRYLGEFTPLRDVETMVADNFYQAVYIPDENDRSGIYAYGPDGSDYKRSGTNRFGSGGIFEKDGEGIVVYIHKIDGQDTGRGLIIVADQRKPVTDFEFFDRKTWSHLGTLRIPGVANTDGIASTQQALPGYPLGLLAVVNDDSTVMGVGWDRIFEVIGLELE
jgi:hypothetical protein